MIKVIFMVGVSLALGACAAKKTIYKGVEPISELRCNVKVYVTQEEAKENGEIEELCSISGGGSVPTLSDKEAVAKIKDRVCECGANNAYVVRTSKGFLGTRTASVIGFRYTSKKEDTQK